MELAIDTSNEVAGLALSEEGEILTELVWVVGRNHTKETIPALQGLLEHTGKEIRELKGVIVAKGPGSFSGVRVGLSIAKGLSFALGIPLVGISTLEAIAFPYAQFRLPICPLLRFGRELAVALFQLQGDEFVKLVEEQISDPIGICSEVEGQIIFCGEVGGELASHLRQELGDKALILSSRLRRPGYLCELGWRRITAGSRDDPNTLQPLYLKKPSITLGKK